MKSEHRNSNRQTAEYPAQIDLGGSRLPCQLRDVSSSGARILVQATKNIPDDFVLLLTGAGSARRFCHVAWRTERELGVKFQMLKQQPLGTPVLQAEPPAQEPDSEIVKLDT